jgi:hypothetical protein
MPGYPDPALLGGDSHVSETPVSPSRATPSDRPVSVPITLAGAVSGTSYLHSTTLTTRRTQ